MSDLPSAHFKRARQVVAERLWDVAHWLYPYEQDSPWTESERRYWEANVSVTFEGTKEHAEHVMDAVTELTCPNPGHHPLTPCNFMVGSAHVTEVTEEVRDADDAA